MNHWVFNRDVEMEYSLPSILYMVFAGVEPFLSSLRAGFGVEVYRVCMCDVFL